MWKAARLSLLAVLSASFPFAAAAADFELLAFGTRTSARGGNAFGDSRINVGHDNGYGAGVNIRWSRLLTTELAASVARPDANAFLTSTAPATTLGNLKMMPVTATVQFHPLPASRLDPYVGAGAAYVHFDRLRSAPLAGVNVDAITFDSRIKALANAGVSFHAARNIGAFVDAKYIPLTARGSVRFTDAPAEPIDLRLNPLIFAAGLRFGL